MPSKLDPSVSRLARQIGKQIRAARIRVELSQEVMAQRIGMTRTNYARIEYGKTNLTIETLLRVAEGLGTDLKVTLGSVPKR